MRWLLIALGTLIALLLVVYFWPVPAKSFAELAEKVDPAPRQSLLAFRAQHPEKTVVDGREWRYIAFGEGPLPAPTSSTLFTSASCRQSSITRGISSSANRAGDARNSGEP